MRAAHAHKSHADVALLLTVQELPPRYADARRGRQRAVLGPQLLRAVRRPRVRRAAGGAPVYRQKADSNRWLFLASNNQWMFGSSAAKDEQIALRYKEATESPRRGHYAEEKMAARS